MKNIESAFIDLLTMEMNKSDCWSKAYMIERLLIGLLGGGTFY
jgi:hypothetical protein